MACVFFVIFLMCLSGILATCPQQCFCGEDELKAVCHRSNLTDIPDGVFLKNLHKLDLAWNQVKVLKNDAFVMRDIVELRLLNLSNNVIELIELDAFRGLDDLEVIDLSFNNIGVISQQMFDGVGNLKELVLKSNRFIQLPEAGFNLIHLKKLDLSDCQIRKLPPNFFNTTPSIEHLNLENNEITRVDMNEIATLPHLRHLKLRKNLLDVLQLELIRLPERVVVELGGNPWRCDCQFAEDFVKYRERNHTSVLVCHSPEQLRDVVASQSLIDMLKCDKPNDIVTDEASVGWLIVFGIFVFVGLVMFIFLKKAKKNEICIMITQHDDAKEQVKIKPYNSRDA